MTHGTGLVSGRAVIVNASNSFGTASSSRRHKENIVPYTDLQNKILSLSPVTFDYKPNVLTDENESERLNQFGMIAEDLDDVGLTHLVHYGAQGEVEGINYPMLAVELLGVIKNLNTRLEILEQNT